MGLRERKKLATRSRIRDAALDLFAENGYEATTIEEIAADADVSVTTFFRYYPSKGEVLFVDGDRWFPAIRELLENRPVDEPDVVAVHRALRSFHEEVGAEDDQRRLRRRRVVATSPELRGRANEVSEAWRHEVARGLAARRGSSADSSDIRLTAALALAVLGFAEDEWSAAEGEPDWLPFLDHAFACYQNLESRGGSGEA